MCSAISHSTLLFQISLVAQRLKRLPAMWKTWVRSLGWEDLLEKEMTTHSSTLAWRIPWTEIQSTGLQRVGHNWATSLSLSASPEVNYRSWHSSLTSGSANRFCRTWKQSKTKKRWTGQWLQENILWDKICNRCKWKSKGGSHSALSDSLRPYRL